MERPAFHWGFVWAALAMAIFAGFAIGAHLTAILGFGFIPSPGFVSYIQIHGHAQLLGWVGLLIMGISLHVLPRIAGARLPWPRRVKWILWLMVYGLSLRILAHSMLPYVTGTYGFGIAMGAVVVSGVLEWVGIAFYVVMLGRAVRTVPADSRPALAAIKPYVGSMLVGWGLYACLNAGLVLDMARQQGVIVDPGWNHVAIEAFIGFVLLPVAFAFSVRFFPLYLRLAGPDWPVRQTAYAYLLGVGLHVVPAMPPMQQMLPRGMSVISQVGMVLTGVVLLWFIGRLGVLTPRWLMNARRLTKPERQLRTCRQQSAAGLNVVNTANPAISTGEPFAVRRTRRAGLTPGAAFGRFDRLIYTAYMWLGIAACSEIVSGIAGLVGADIVIHTDVIRHLYVLGFVTLLVMGVAVRMLPGFQQKRQVASPGLVTATLCLGNAAVITRLLLVGAPGELWQMMPSVVGGLRIGFGLSGMLGLIAVMCLALNLWRTVRG